MKSVLLTTTLLLFGLPAFAQTQTNTNCDAYGNQINCTSTSYGDKSAAIAQQQKEIDENLQKSGAALGAIVAQRRAQKNMEDAVVRSLTYCGTHPDEKVLNPVSNHEVDCPAFVERARLACISYPKDHFCKSVPAASSSASTAGQTAPASLPPAPVSPVSPAALSPTPTALATRATAPTPTPAITAEQKDAMSYCQRNPSATITWNNGTVSPCSSVLGVQ
jgi:hypothetical protein